MVTLRLMCQRLCWEARRSVLVDVHPDVHAGYQGESAGVGERNAYRDHLGDLLEVAGAVGFREQRELVGGRALDLRDDAGDRGAGEGVDVDVDLGAGVDVGDVGLVDPGGHVDLVEVVGGGQLGAGGDPLSLDGVVDRDGAVAGGLDGPLRLRAAAAQLDPAHDLVPLDHGALGAAPVDQGARIGCVDLHLVAVDLRVVGADEVSFFKEAGTT